MAAVEIQVTASIANYDFTTTINNATYTFVFGWNNRDKCWYVDVQNADGGILIAGIKACLGAFLGRTAQGVSPFKDGVFVVVDTSGQGLESGFDDFGTRTKMRYFASEDLIARIQKVQLDAATK